MNKIFAPINRWKFIFYIFLFWIFSGLYTNFGMFFDLHGITAFYVICAEILIVLLIVFKRLFDIFDKLWKSVIFALFFVLLLIVIFILSISTVTYDLNGIATSNKIVLLLYPLYSSILVLFLSLKNGKNSKFFNFEWKIILKRITLLIFIFCIYQFLTLSFNTILPQVDYRMYPSLELHDKLLVSKITKITSLNREDIVCVKKKDGLPNPLRIIGLPNEEIKLDRDKIYINEELYSDEFAFYSKNLKPINYKETLRLNNNSYFLMGDNRLYDKKGKIFAKDKNGNMSWKPISAHFDNEIYMIIQRDELFGKVIGVHYDNFKVNNKYSDKKVSRKNISYKFAFMNKKFGFNPSSVFENIFGTP